MDRHSFAVVFCFILSLAWKTSHSFNCYVCSSAMTADMVMQYTECRDATFRTHDVLTVECNTSCVAAKVNMLPGFNEAVKLFDKDHDEKISTEEAKKALAVVRAMERNKNTSQTDFQELMVGYSSEEIKIVFKKLDKNSDGILSEKEIFQLFNNVGPSTTETQLQYLLNNFDPIAVSRACFQDIKDPGCLGPEVHPDIASGDSVYCFCRSDKCNGPALTTNKRNRAMTWNNNDIFVGIVVGVEVLFLQQII